MQEMIDAGLHPPLPMRFPDPGKPEGIRTFRKPILTLEKIDVLQDTSGRSRRPSALSRT